MDRKEEGGGAEVVLSAQCLVSKDKVYAEKLFSIRSHQLSQHLRGLYPKWPLYPLNLELHVCIIRANHCLQLPPFVFTIINHRSFLS